MNTWNGLPDDVKAILTEMGSEWAGVTAKVCARNDAEGLAKLKELGVDVKSISEEAKVEWATALKDFPNKMAQDANGRDLPGSEVLNFYMSKIEELGHEWPYRYEIK